MKVVLQVPKLLDAFIPSNSTTSIHIQNEKEDLCLLCLTSKHSLRFISHATTVPWNMSEKELSHKPLVCGFVRLPMNCANNYLTFYGLFPLLFHYLHKIMTEKYYQLLQKCSPWLENGICCMKTGYVPLPSSGPEEVMNHASDTDGAGQIQNVNGWCLVT